MSLLSPVTSDAGFRWNDRTARHLLNRAGFGVPNAAIDKLAAIPVDQAVAWFVDFEKFADAGPAVPDTLPRYNYRELRDMLQGKTEEEKQKIRSKVRREAKEAITDLQGWWLQRMASSGRPLQEKLALFWHGHFATSAEKVQDPEHNLEINQIFREMGSGNFRELTRAVGHSPAMLRYLDQQQSNAKKPNENWARELLELFTVGIGNYTEQDIKEGARAFTGWNMVDGKFTFAQRRHDDGTKTIFGKTGHFDGDDAIDIITAQPACPEFICRKLWTYFAYDNPEPEVVQGLAQTMRANDLQIKPVLRQMFMSRAFYQDKAINTQVKSPAQLVVGLMVQLDAILEARPPIAQLGMRAMGQSLFHPPNVKGWDGGRAWINTNTLLIRYNFSNFLVSGVIPDFGRGGGGNLRRELLMAAMGKSPSTGAPSMMDDDDGMMAMSGKPAEAERESPAGQDAMAKDIPSKTLYQALKQRRGNKGERPARRDRKKMDEMDIAPFDARGFFARFEGMTADRIIDSLSQYFIGFPLEAQQQLKLKQALAQGVQPGQPVPVKRMAEEDLRATVQLLLSTAEYQVC